MKFTSLLLGILLSLQVIGQRTLSQKSFSEVQSKIKLPKEEEKFDFVGSGALILVGSTAALLFTKHDSPSVRTPVLMLMGVGYSMMIGGAISRDRERNPKEL